MMRVTTTFLRGGVAASNQVRKKTLLALKQQEAGRKQNFDRRGDFRNQQRSERRRDKFTLLTKSPKEILALDKVGHNTHECMHLKRQIEELIKAGKLSHNVARQGITQSFSPNPEISFPSLGDENGTEGPMIIEA
ncbi:hypothetical protein Tco_1141103 [Tanacetum coccineum]